MTIRFAAPLALIALSVAVPSFAAAGQAAPAEQATEQSTTDATPAKQRKICRTETATGSVMPKRVCRTVEQAEQDQRNAERFRDQQNRMGASNR